MNLIINFIHQAFFFFNEIAIYLVFGFLMAGLLHLIFPEKMVMQHLGKNNLTSVLKATLFGIPLPLCSCGVIPVAASIRRKGASPGATLSFLIATPQIGTDSFMITYSLIGWIFGIFRIVASFITAIFSGIITNIFAGDENSEIRPEQTPSKDTRMGERLKNLFPYIQIELFGSFVDYLILGIVIAGIIAVVVPNSFFENYLGNQFFSMLIMLIVGIPMYICATASTPIAASLLLKGLSPGAALVFLLAGPATNAITISTVFKTMGKKAVVIYLSSIAIVSVILGYLLNFLAFERQIAVINLHHHSFIPEWLHLLGSVILFLMIIGHYFYHYLLPRFKEQSVPNSMKTLTVNGMNCTHCATTVKETVGSITGNDEIRVDLSQQKVFFKYDSKNLDLLKKAITEKGYDVIEND